MATSTRDRFQAAINAAATPTAAAGMVTAMHLANMRELFQELDALLDKYSNWEMHTDLNALKAEYTA